MECEVDEPEPRVMPFIAVLCPCFPVFTEDFLVPKLIEIKFGDLGVSAVLTPAGIGSEAILGELTVFSSRFSSFRMSSSRLTCNLLETSSTTDSEKLISELESPMG